MEHVISNVAIIISVGTAIAVGISTLYAHKNYSKERKKVYAEISMNISSDYLKITQEIAKSKDLTRLFLMISDYVNYSDVLSHLLNKEKIDKEIGEFFEIYLHDAYNSGIFIEKKIKMKIMDKEMNLKKWCQENPSKITIPITKINR